MYEEEIKQKEIEVKQCTESNYDREDFVYEDEEGKFYQSLDDYDYQYRLLTNIL